MGPDENEHKSFTIIVNAQPREWAEKDINYDQAVLLAFPEPAPPGIIITYTVEYERAQGNKDGSLVQGGPSVKVKDRMVFSVTETSRS